ncbi:14278_t:CDS:2 [Acaulospora colombiana]|uniref:14278_t:CDS:1 n=1 Tax=Acaulospora colombiana TaxID=27376 RepID=A0ACA9ME90_9GLOM|nr:14278_t:CDS:2 [Acaulospora colombiana]
MGANLLGETVMFGVAASLIIWEQTSRQYNLDDTIEKLKDETRELKAGIEKLQDDNENLKNRLNQVLAAGPKSKWRTESVSEGGGYNQQEDRQEDQVDEVGKEKIKVNMLKEART